ncbi:MAG: PH domain-containing protein [Candidatus Uhrbacteria bacterium]
MMDLNHLPNSRPGEKVKLFLRRHWLTPLGIIFHAILLIVIPILGLWYFQTPVEIWLARPFAGPLTIVGLSLYFLAVWLFALMEYVDYYLDVWIITNERIINIEQKGLFTRVASELHLSAIEDATSETKGMIQTFFNFGNVHIQTAGERTRFIFKNVAHPEKIKEEVVALIEISKKTHSQELAQAVSQAIK